MLIVLPPSETKRPPPETGSPVALESLSFPELTALRSRILDALIETSGRPDAFQRLQVKPTLVGDVMRNLDILELPAVPVLELYSGPLYQGLDAATLCVAATERAQEQVIVLSALWGALRPADRIPAYRLNVCARLAGMDRLEPRWRALIPNLLAEAAGPHGVIVDLRAPSYQSLGMPTGLRDRTVMLHVQQRAGGGHWVGDVIAKRQRGEAVRLLLESGADCDDPVELEAVLGERWSLSLRPPRASTPWRLSLIADA
jgi:hypothetical protein